MWTLFSLSDITYFWDVMNHSTSFSYFMLRSKHCHLPVGWQIASRTWQEKCGQTAGPAVKSRSFKVTTSKNACAKRAKPTLETETLAVGGKGAKLAASWASLTWAKLLDPPVAGAGVDGQEVFVPGDFGIWVTAGGTQHGGGSSALHHFELRAHVNVWEAWGEQVVCGREESKKKEN